MQIFIVTQRKQNRNSRNAEWPEKQYSDYAHIGPHGKSCWPLFVQYISSCLFLKRDRHIPGQSQQLFCYTYLADMFFTVNTDLLLISQLLHQQKCSKVEGQQLRNQMGPRSNQGEQTLDWSQKKLELLLTCFDLFQFAMTPQGCSH